MAARKRTLPTRAPHKRPTHGGGVARPLQDRTTVQAAPSRPNPLTHADLVHARLQAGLHAPGFGHSGFRHPEPVTANGHHGHASLLDTGPHVGPTVARPAPVNPPTGVPSGFHAPVQQVHAALPWTPFPGSGNVAYSGVHPYQGTHLGIADQGPAPVDGGHYTGLHLGAASQGPAAAVRTLRGVLPGAATAPAILGSPLVRHPGLPTE